MRLRVALTTIMVLAALPWSAHAAPLLNSLCTIELRRDAIGPVNGGTVVAFTGKITSIADGWVCLTLDDKREIWIPVTSIQFIQVTPSKV